MDIGTYIEANNNPTVDILHTFENVPERDQSSFFDDISEKQVINEVVIDERFGPSTLKHDSVELLSRANRGASAEQLDSLSVGSHLRNNENENHANAF